MITAISAILVWSACIFTLIHFQPNSAKSLKDYMFKLKLKQNLLLMGLAFSPVIMFLLFLLFLLFGSTSVFSALYNWQSFAAIAATNVVIYNILKSLILSRITSNKKIPIDSKHTITANYQEKLNIIVTKLAKKAGIKTPECYVITRKDGTADYSTFAYTGQYNNGTNVICFDDVSMGILPTSKISAIVAHEIGHIKHNDFTNNIGITVFASKSAYITASAVLFLALYASLNNALLIDSFFAMVTLLVPIALCYFIFNGINLLINNTIQRNDEYLADAYAVKTTSMSDMYLTLSHLRADEENYLAANYTKEEIEAYKNNINELLQSHPLLEKRITSIGKMIVHKK